MSNLDLIMEYASWSRLTSSSSHFTTQVVLPSSFFQRTFPPRPSSPPHPFSVISAPSEAQPRRTIDWRAFSFGSTYADRHHRHLSSLLQFMQATCGPSSRRRYYGDQETKTYLPQVLANLGEGEEVCRGSHVIDQQSCKVSQRSFNTSFSDKRSEGECHHRQRESNPKLSFRLSIAFSHRHYHLDG